MKSHYSLLICLFSVFCSNSQEVKISGIITSKQTNVVEGASVVITHEQKTLGYTYSDQEGFFSLTISVAGFSQVIVEINSMGYASFKSTLQLKNKEHIVIKNIDLKEKFESLSEVVIKSDKKIKISKDTITYKVSAFKNGSEKTVEDALKQLPGIEVSDTGIIRVMGTPIQKILIEGDDLSGSNYKVLSKNLDVSTIKEVEVINNFEGNHIVRQYIDSGNIALNLKLKDSIKSVVFGRLDLGLGIQSRYNADLNIGLIKKKIKVLDLAFLNNVGKQAGIQYKKYTHNNSPGFNLNKTLSIDLQPINTLKGSMIFLEDKNYIENNSFSNALMLNKRFSDSLVIRNSFSIYQDKHQQQYSKTNKYLIDPEPIVYSEVNDFDNKNLNIINDFTMNYKASDKSSLIVKSKSSIEKINNRNDLNFEETQIKQQLKNSSKNVDLKIQYTKKTKKGIFNTNAYFAIKSLKQSYSITPNTLSNNNTSQNNAIVGTNKNHLNKQAVESIWLIKQNNTTYSYGLGLQHLSEEINTSAIESANNSLSSIDSLIGNNKANSIEPYLTFNLRQKLSKVFFLTASATPKINSYKNGNIAKFFFLPEYNTSLAYSKPKLGSLTLGYGHKTKLPRLLNFIDNYFIKNYRAIAIGSKNIEAIKQRSLSLTYNYSNLDKRLFFNTMLSYISYKNQIVNQNQLSTSQDIVSKTYISGQKLMLLNMDLTTYFKFMESSIKFGFKKQTLFNPQIINYNEIDITNRSNAYYISGTSFFKGSFDYKFLFQYIHNIGKTKNTVVTNKNLDFDLELIFKINRSLYININNNLYFRNTELYETNTLQIEYRPKDEDWFLGLRIHNLLNTEHYTFDRVSNFTQSRNAFNAIPTYGYAYYSFRF